MGTVDTIRAITSADCRLRQRRIDWTRTNKVGADTTVLQVCGPGSHERADGSFTRA